MSNQAMSTAARLQKRVDWRDGGAPVVRVRDVQLELMLPPFASPPSSSSSMMKRRAIQRSESRDDGEEPQLYLSASAIVDEEGDESKDEIEGVDDENKGIKEAGALLQSFSFADTSSTTLAAAAGATLAQLRCRRL